MASTLIRVSLQRKGGLSLLKQSQTLTKSGISRTFGKTPFSTATANSAQYAVPVLACFSPYIKTYCLEEKVGIGGITDQGEEIKKVYERALVRSQEKKLHNAKSRFQKFKAYLERTLRMWMRALKLMACLSPVIAFYPVQRLLSSGKDHNPDMDAHELALSNKDYTVEGPLGWYLRLCLQCVEYSGAAVIKLMQWAGSRPDMFGHDFCAVFSKLQDDTTPHSWKHTEKVLKEAYGPEWHKRIKINKNELMGSGCIGQVYKGEMIDKDGNPMKVAVKVLHPSVEANIDADLDLLRWFVRTVQSLPWDIFSNLKWINLEGGIDEFDDMLKLQLDCRVEAANLKQFNENFKDSEHVEFPKVVEGFEPSRDVLIETFCEGVPVIKFAKEHRENQELLSEMCYVAIETVCKMIFLDNFMHGDLHPGNVFIDPDRKKFVLFDVGIVNAYTEDDHENIVDILTSFIRREGRKAGRLMIDGSNRLLRDSGDHAVDEERFIDKIEAMNKKATSSDYLMEHLGTYITQICDAAAEHHVLMNQAFISAALAVKIQEGIALALDPSIEIVDVATPILYESERKRGAVMKRAANLLGIGEWFKGLLN